LTDLNHILHDVHVEALMPQFTHVLQGGIAFRFGKPELKRVKVINSDVCKKLTKLTGFHSNVPWATAKLM